MDNYSIDNARGKRVALLAFGPGGPSGVSFFHNDHLGTPKVITDKKAKVKWAAAHTPFGSALVSVDKVENPFRFPGQYADEETGLYYNYFRDYGPATGRYIESDPIELDGSLNTYFYASANPIRYFDSSGLEVWDGEFMHADPARKCRYYSKVCRQTGGKRVYPCFIAETICRSPIILFPRTGNIPLDNSNV